MKKCFLCGEESENGKIIFNKWYCMDCVEDFYQEREKEKEDKED